jgi:hypothetical protein
MRSSDNNKCIVLQYFSVSTLPPSYICGCSRGSLIFLVSIFFFFFFCSLVCDHFIVSYLPRKKKYDQHKEQYWNKWIQQKYESSCFIENSGLKMPIKFPLELHNKTHYRGKSNIAIPKQEQHKQVSPKT